MSGSRAIEYATFIVKKLFDAGYTAYFAGGWVRDFLMGASSDEIDIATSAPPEKILSFFPKTVPVGIAFGVVIVVHEGQNFEISTFRKDHPYLDGRHPDGVDFSTPEKDALRRDFTINGMFYDPLTKTIYDYVGGQQDLQKGIIRAIGNPSERFEEDRLRMLRAIRFKARFGFTLEKATEIAISEHASRLFPAVSMERVWQELVKMSQKPRFDQAINDLHRLKILATIFPELEEKPLSFIEEITSHFPYFPLNTPTICYLLELFPHLNLQERLLLCSYLKVTSQDVKLVEFFTHSTTLFSQNDPDKVEWVHFYAHPHANLFLEIQGAKTSPRNRGAFFDAHETRKQELSFYIERRLQKKPLVNATMLMREGINPGELLGKLLKESERLSITHEIQDADMLLKKLKQSPLWP